MKRHIHQLAGGLAALLFLGCQAKAAAPELPEGTAEVTATGVGMTAEAAQKNAVINAVQQVVGLYIDSETFVKNEQLLVDQVLSVSSGFVTSFEVKSPLRKRLTDGLFETTIRAVVKKGQVAEQLTKTKIVSVSVNAQDAWAEAFSRLQNAQDGRRLLEKYWPELVMRLLQARVVDDSGRPIKGASRPAVKPDADTGLVWCAWNIEVSYDMETYFNEVVPRLRRIFDAICVRKGEEPLTFRTPPRTGYPLGIGGTPILWLLNASASYEDRPSWSSAPPRPAQDEFNLVLMTSRDKTGLLRNAEAYVLERDYWKVLAPALQRNAVIIKVIGRESALLLTDRLPMDRFYLEPRPGEQSQNTLHIPFTARCFFIRFTGLLMDMPSPWSSDWQMWLIGPEFKWFETYGGGHILNRLVLRYETRLDPEQLKDISELQLSFRHEGQ